MRTKVPSIVVCCLSLLGPWMHSAAAENQPTVPADAKLSAFFREYLDHWFAFRPLDATRLGEHRFDDKLDDLSKAAREAWVEHHRQALERLSQEVDYQGLSRAAQIDYEILKHELVTSIWLAENTRPYEEDPRIYNDYINDSVYLLLTQSTLPKETNIANCIARMSQVPKIVAAARASLQNPPRTHTETAIRQNRGAIGFYEKDLFEIVGATDQRAALQAAAAAVAQSLRQYQTFLEQDLLPRATGDWRLGKEKFARKLELTLNAGLTADQVLADAELEFERVQREMYVIARQLWSRGIL